MGKLILFIILGLAAGMYFPDSRAVLLEKGEPVLRPVFIWSTDREIEEIIRGLQQMENVERRLPERREWVTWIETHYTGDASRDPWGNVYLFELQEDSFAVISHGPDRVMKTGDEIRHVRVRNWRAK